MSSVLSHVRRIWRDHIAGPTLRTYEQACEELGGMPWRPATETDRWFLSATPQRGLPSVEKLPTLDTGAINLKRTMSDGTKLLFVGAAAILLFVVVAVLLSGGGASAQAAAVGAAPATIAAPPASAAPASAAVNVPTATAPAVTAPALPSPSVQSLFSARAKPAPKKHVALARHRKK